MLTQEKINAPDTLLKLYVAIDEDLKVLRPHLQAPSASPRSAGRDAGAECRRSADDVGLGRMAGMQR